MKYIGVLGDGITAKAVKSFINKSDAYQEVPLESAEIIITSPGIPPRKWPKVAVEIISDIEFAYRELIKQGNVPTIIGITGTNGKTTVAAGIAHGLGVTAYGNIGQPLISKLDELQKTKPIVLELSSFQLYSSPTLHCDIGIIVNIEPDHLDWHETFGSYKMAKKTMIKSSNQKIYIPQILTQDVQDLNENIQIIDTLPNVNWEQFSGNHNQLNAALIYQVLLDVGQESESIHTAMSTFNVPPFRCEAVFSNQSLTIINDSKATNMAATMAAINSFSEKKLLILSGEPKDRYSTDWLESVFKSCSSVYATGYLNEHRTVFPEKFQSKILFFSNLKSATEAAIKNFKDGVILFSPSAASFDEFKNYIERGEAFNSYVFEAI